jgi:ribosome maturation factor RimP
LVNTKIEDKLFDLATPIAKNMGYEITDIEFKKEGTHWFLRVYIDIERGITLDDCQHFSEALSNRLDEVDPIPQSYILEVSSPGIDRPLKKDKDFEKFKGHDVDVKLYVALDGNKKFQGTLEGLIDDIVHVKVNNELLKIPREKISGIRLTVKF